MISNTDFFDRLKQIADAIVAMFGKNCEVAIHDLSDLQSSLIYLAGNVTNRQAGAPATDLLVTELQKDPATIRDICNYSTTSGDGRNIKSTTTFLRNSSGDVVAALCINLDTTDFFNASQLLSQFVNDPSFVSQDIQETFSLSVGETIDALFDQTIHKIGLQPVNMTTSERIEFVAQLEEQGIFQMKGGVEQVAKRTGVSKYSIYNYIKNIRNQKSQKGN